MSTLAIILWLFSAFCLGIVGIRWFFHWWLVRSARGLARRWFELYRRYMGNPELQLLADECMNWGFYWSAQALWVEGGRIGPAPVRPKSRSAHR